MTTKPERIPPNAQAKTNKRKAFVLDCERSSKIAVVQAFGFWVRKWFDPQRGVSTKSPGNDRRWFDRVKGCMSPVDLRRHVEGKQSLAVTWGANARVRVIDADAHGKASPMDALATLWEAIRALHLGRDIWVKDLVNGAIPGDAKLDGVIVTTPNGLHYLEFLDEPWQGDTQRDDAARTTKALREMCVDVRPGRIEVLPSPNGQARLPLGYGCSFVWPPLGKVTTERGLEILEALQPVARTFEALGEGHRREDVKRIDELVDDEPTWLQCSEQSETFIDHNVILPVKKQSRWRKTPRNKEGVMLYEGEGFSGRRQGPSGKSAFIEKMEAVLRNGASAGSRNSQLWELCILHRCTWGMSREDSEDRITSWAETAPHTSKDLADTSRTARRAAKRSIVKHLDRIDAGLASGKFYQLGARKSDAPKREPLLLQVDLSEELGELESLGNDFLRGTNFMHELPAWMQRAVPRIIGGVVKWSCNGKIAIPTAAVSRYAGTKKSKRCPFTGETRSSYKILLDALQRFGVIGGLLATPNRGKRLAGVYESNVCRDVVVETPVVVVASWPKHHNVKRSAAPWKRAPYAMGCRRVRSVERAWNGSSCKRGVVSTGRGPPRKMATRSPFGLRNQQREVVLVRDELPRRLKATQVGHAFIRRKGLRWMIEWAHVPVAFQRFRFLDFKLDGTDVALSQDRHASAPASGDSPRGIGIACVGSELRGVRQVPLADLQELRLRRRKT